MTIQLLYFQRLVVCAIVASFGILGGCGQVATPRTEATSATTQGSVATDAGSSKTSGPAKVPPGTKLAATEFTAALTATGADHVVVQVFAEYCGPCMTEALALNDRLDAWRGQGIAVLGLGMDDTPASVEAFYQQTGRRIQFPLYTAPWFAEQQDVALTPTLFIYDRAGQQLFRADAESHPTGVLEAIEDKLK